MEMYARLGFGLWLVELRGEHVSIGICGLLKRDALDDIDVGFAFLARYQRKGYALEAARATMAYAEATLGVSRLAAVTSPDNEGSRRLLEKLGFRFKRVVRLAENLPEVNLYAAACNLIACD